MSALVHALVNKVRAPLGSRSEAVAETASALCPSSKSLDLAANRDDAVTLSKLA